MQCAYAKPQKTILLIYKWKNVSHSIIRSTSFSISPKASLHLMGPKDIHLMGPKDIHQNGWYATPTPNHLSKHSQESHKASRVVGPCFWNCWISNRITNGCVWAGLLNISCCCTFHVLHESAYLLTVTFLPKQLHIRISRRIIFVDVSGHWPFRCLQK